MLPDERLDIIRMLRTAGKRHTGLTADSLSTIEHKGQGLGADDYLVKPFAFAGHSPG